MLVTLKDLFREKKDHALAGFNVFGYEDALMVIRAGEATGEGVALMINRDAAAHMPLRYLGPLLRKMAEDAKVSVAVHLDHAVEIGAIEEAIASGFSSVMFDGSQLEIPENVEKTRRVVELAHAQGLSVEAEIGSVGYSDPNMKAKHRYTEPEEAKSFYEATGVDCLAVSVGTVHRMTEQKAVIQYDRIAAIQQAVDVPLVIHGASGARDEDLTKMSHAGIKKINLGTCLRLAFGHGMRRVMEADPEIFDRIRIMQQAMPDVQAAAEQKIRLLG